MHIELDPNHKSGDLSCKTSYANGEYTASTFVTGGGRIEIVEKNNHKCNCNKENVPIITKREIEEAKKEIKEMLWAYNELDKIKEKYKIDVLSNKLAMFMVKIEYLWAKLRRSSPPLDPPK